MSKWDFKDKMWWKHVILGLSDWLDWPILKRYVSFTPKVSASFPLIVNIRVWLPIGAWNKTSRNSKDNRFTTVLNKSRAKWAVQIGFPAITCICSQCYGPWPSLVSTIPSTGTDPVDMIDIGQFKMRIPFTSVKHVTVFANISIHTSWKSSRPTFQNHHLTGFLDKGYHYCSRLDPPFKMRYRFHGISKPID